MTAFAGHSPNSTSKAIYTDPSVVAPAERLYAVDVDDNYDPADFDTQPGATARANGYPRKS